MARVLIVGCGCRGQRLARALIEGGHAVRGTTRSVARLAEIEAAGAEGVLADPDRLATLTHHLQGISVMVWLMGTATGSPEAVAALHGPRLESMIEAIVDTHVRGVAYERGGSVSPELLDEGATVVERLSKTYLMPAVVVRAQPTDIEPWLAAMSGAVARALTDD